MIAMEMIGLDWISLFVALGGLVGIYVKLEVSLKAIQTRQDNMDKRLDLLNSMVDKQIEVDDSIKKIMNKIEVSQGRLEEKITFIHDRLERGN